MLWFLDINYYLVCFLEQYYFLALKLVRYDNIFVRFRSHQIKEIELYCTRVRTSKRVTSAGVHLRSSVPGSITPKKHRSGGEPLATQCAI